ncbi:YrdC-like domain-containing protein [Haematococcus lacustris]|uniref:YrdC-like domain-containing protein n=1 Tax=Haematococcus lacustris TaxID=44745 RepID=A0A699YUB1_HAELA|nr:YrdC-like domain-containing protein [Haematococcus lacustris]
MEDLAGRIPLVLDGGPCSLGLESTGLLVYSKDLHDAALEQAPTTPGMKYRHYSPTAQGLD